MTAERLEKLKETPTEGLTCNCCGDYCRGRQWHNRDTGYGTCPTCIAWFRERKMSEAEIIENYGYKGVHWGVE